MKPSVLLFGALFASALACEKSQLSEHGQTRAHVIAAIQASDKTPPKPQPTPASPSAPAKKPAPKERDQRPTPPPHLFM